MRKAVDPMEILNGEDISADLEKALEDPFSVNFRPNEKDLIEVYPEHLQFRQATVDLANNNVEVQTNVQRETEGYTAFIYGNGTALVESEVKISVEDHLGYSTMYYLVTEDDTLVYDQNHWEEIYNPTPRQVAETAPKLYKQAKQNTPNQTPNTGRSVPETVPPPQQGDLTEPE